MSGKTESYEYSEAWRFNCEVNMVQLMDKNHRDNYLIGVAEKRGKPAAKQIWDELIRRKNEARET